MKKILYKFKYIFIFSIVLLLLLSSFKQTRARNIPGEGEDCPNGVHDCVIKYGGIDDEWLCTNRICIYKTPPFLDSFLKAVKSDEEKGSLSHQSYAILSLVDLANAAIVGMTGDVTNPERTGYRNNGLIGVLANLTGSLYSNPPASGIEYFADLGRNFGLVKPAYAQGIGFSGLKNLLPLWKASRNLAYIFSTIAFMAIGMAIMFRVKLDPKTVITFQNAIPKMVIALILVTFSYAITGLMIDFMYLIIYLGVLAIGQTGWLGNAASVGREQAKYISLTFKDALGLIFGGELKAIYSILGGFLGTGIVATILIALGGIVGTASAGLGALVASLPLLILLIIALFCVFKLFFALLTCYLYIIISLIVGPLQITMGVLPGNQSGFGGWFKNLMANILVFPAVAMALLLGWLLAGAHGPAWVPPVLGTSGGALPSILGFAILLLLPKIPDIVKTSITKAKPSGYGTAIGEALGPAKFGGKVVIGGGVERGYDALTGVHGGRTVVAPGSVGRGVLDVLKSGADRMLKKM